MSVDLLPRARLWDVACRRARLVGSRLDPDALRGWVSPIEPQLVLGILYVDPAATEKECLARTGLRSDVGVLLRTLWAHVLSPSGEDKANERPWVISACVDNISVDEALDKVLAPLAGRSARIVHYAHPHILNLAHQDPALAECLVRAHLVLPDGVGIRVAARILGISMRHNLNGTDMWPPLLRRASELGLPVALIGSTQEVVQAAADRIRNDYPQLELPIHSHGYLADEESHVVAARVADLGPCLVLVGMGSPRQELWAWEYLSNHPDIIVVTVGGLFDFIGGVVPRAPVVWRELGLEWLYRLTQEPRRLVRRYLVGNPLFLARALRQRFLGK